MTNDAPQLSEEFLSKVFAMLGKYETVEQLMETGEFRSLNELHAAVHELERRGKVRAKNLFGPDEA